MSRFLTSIVILLGLIVVSIVSLLLLGNECRRYAAYAEDTALAYSRRDIPGSLEAFDHMEAEWAAFHHVTGLFIDGSKLDAIRWRMIALRPMIEAESAAVPAELESIRQLIGGLYEEELPVLWHIL